MRHDEFSWFPPEPLARLLLLRCKPCPASTPSAGFRGRHKVRRQHPSPNRRRRDLSGDDEWQRNAVAQRKLAGSSSPVGLFVYRSTVWFDRASTTACHHFIRPEAP